MTDLQVLLGVEEDGLLDAIARVLESIDNLDLSDPGDRLEVAVEIRDAVLAFMEDE